MFNLYGRSMQKTSCLMLKGTAWLQASDLEARLLRTFRLLAPMGSHIKTVSTSKTTDFGIGKICLTACSLCFIVSEVHGSENCMEQEGNVKPNFLRKGVETVLLLSTATSHQLKIQVLLDGERDRRNIIVVLVVV